MADIKIPKGIERDRPNSEKDWRYIVNVMRSFMKTHGGYCRIQQTPYGQPLPKPDPLGKSLNIWNNWVEIGHNRLWAAGLDTPEPYMPVHSGASPSANDVKVERNTWMSTTKWHLRVVDKIKLGIQDRATNKIVTAMDRKSVHKALEAKFMQKSRIVNNSNPRFKEDAEAMGVPLKLPAGQPQNLLEWQLFGGENIKDAASMAIELVLSLCDVKDDYMKRIRPEMAKELFETGVLILVTLRDASGFPYRKVIRLDDALLPVTRDNWADPEWMGFYEELSYEQVAERTNEFSEKQWARVRKLAERNSTGFISGSNSPKPDLGGKVRVLTMFFKDTNKFTAGDGPDGFRRPIDPSEAGDYDNVKSTPYEVWYQGSLIVEDGVGYGSPGWDDKTIDDEEKGPLCWDCGHANGSQRMRSAIGRVRPPMVAKALRMNDMVVKAPAAIGREHYQAVNQLANKLGVEVDAIRGPGIQFDPSLLAGLPDGKGGMTSPLESFELWVRENILLIKELTADEHDVDRRRGTGVQVLASRVGPVIELMQMLREALSLFEMSMGFNDASVGNTLKERQAARNVMAMQAATDRSQDYLYTVQDHVECDAAYSTYGVVQDLVKSGRDIEDVVKLFGEPGVQVVRFTADMDPGDIGIELEVRMTDTERQDMMDVLAQDKAQGLITTDEWVEAKNTKNLKQMFVLLRHRREEREKQQHERQMEVLAKDQEKIQMSNDGQAANAQAALAAEQQFKAAQAAEAHARALELERERSDAKIEAMQVASDLRIQEKDKEIKATLDAILMKIESSQKIAAEGNAVSMAQTIDTNDTALEIAAKNAAAKPKTGAS